MNHEILDDPVKAQAVIKTPFGQVDKIRHGERRFIGIQFQIDDAFGGVHFGDDLVLFRHDLILLFYDKFY